MSNYHQSNEIKLINPSLIDPHPDNPRKNIGDVTDLAASIKANGLLSPLSVVPNGSRFRVIAGHRRLMACKQAGTGAVPCFVLDLDPLQQLESLSSWRAWIEIGVCIVPAAAWMLLSLFMSSVPRTCGIPHVRDC